MIKDIFKFLLFFFLFLFLVFFNSSIFYVFPWGILPIMLIVIVYNAFEKPNYFFGIMLAFMGGILIDIYSSGYIFGLYSICLSFLAISLKLLINKYVRVF
jgi:rod shape-determining protein MreD